MKERKGQYSLGLRDSCLGALGGTGESQVQVKHEPLITATHLQHRSAQPRVPQKHPGIMFVLHERGHKHA